MSCLPKLEYTIRDIISKDSDMRIKDLAGQKFNKLTAIKFSHKDSGNNAMWVFECECSKEIVIRGSEVSRGTTKSCGCLIIENTQKKNITHNMSRTKVYKVWINMKARCFNESDMNFESYGKRGITVCKRWLDFNNFLEDMGEPKKGESIDRVDNNGNYEPDNCRWATPKEQIQNRSNSKYWFIDGVKYESHLDASRSLKIGARTVIQWCEGYYCRKTDKFISPKQNCWSELKYKDDK